METYQQENLLACVEAMGDRTPLDSLLGHGTRVFVFAQPDKLRMPQSIELRFILHLSIDCTAQRRK